MSYRVVLQCLTQMLCPFITDMVPAKVERGECLYWRTAINMQSIRRQFVLPCCSAMLDPDVVPLHPRYGSHQGWTWWVSILNDSDEYVVDKKRICSTVLFSNAWARYCAPAAPISFQLRSSVMSVYIEE